MYFPYLFETIVSSKKKIRTAYGCFFISFEQLCQVIIGFREISFFGKCNCTFGNPSQKFLIGTILFDKFIGGV
jgi:hypothetical protein